MLADDDGEDSSNSEGKKNLLSTVGNLQELFSADGIQNLESLLKSLEEKVGRANHEDQSRGVCPLPKPIDMLALKNPFHAYEDVGDSFSIENKMKILESQLTELLDRVPEETIKDEL